MAAEFNIPIRCVDIEKYEQRPKITNGLDGDYEYCVFVQNPLPSAGGARKDMTIERKK